MTKARDLADLMSEGKTLTTGVAGALGVETDDDLTEVIEVIAEATVELQDENLLNLGVQDVYNQYKLFNAYFSD